MTSIRVNRTKEKLQNGEIVTVISGLQSSDIIDFLGPMGFDAAWIEMEHGSVDWDSLGDMTRACDLWQMASITRINSNDPGLITRTLDRGSMGIVVPHVNSREAGEQAAKFVGHIACFPTTHTMNKEFDPIQSGEDRFFHIIFLVRELYL